MPSDTLDIHPQDTLETSAPLYHAAANAADCPWQSAMDAAPQVQAWRLFRQGGARSPVIAEIRLAAGTSPDDMQLARRIDTWLKRHTAPSDRPNILRLLPAS